MAWAGLSKILQELRRRRLFNTVMLYVIGAWVALQVADLAFPGIDVPESAIKHVWIAAFLLFPLVLLFGWRYDISTGGIKRTPPAAEPNQTVNLHQTDHWLLGALGIAALAVTGNMAHQINMEEATRPPAPVENSIAVLPFETCGEYSRDSRLANGVTSEALNRLAERGRLKVFARTSVELLAGIGLSRAEIAGPLGAEFILSGELCRDESGQLTMTAELSDAKGFIVWSDRFVQKVNQFDQVTERLATAVAAGVAAKLGDVTPTSSEAPVGRLAYEQLLIGNEFWDSGDLEKARAAYTRALEHNPEFPEARFYLAVLSTEGYLSAGREQTITDATSGIEEALRIAKRQLETDDRSAYTHYMVARLTRVLASWEEELAFRWNRADGFGADEISKLHAQFKERYKESERHFRLAITLNPSLTQAYTWLADVVERQGVERRMEALKILEDGQIRDPFNIEYNGLIAKRWANLGRYRQAIELLERFKSLPEIHPEAWWWQLELMSVDTHFDEKCETLIDMLETDPSAFDDVGNRWQIWWFVSQLAGLGLYDEAEAWKARLEDMPMLDWMREYGLHNYLAATSTESARELLAIADDPESLIEELEVSRHARSMWHERATRDDLYLISLYELVGRNEDTDRLLASTSEFLESEYEIGVRNPETLYHLAEVYARQGRDEDAIEMLRKSYQYHGLETCSSLEDYLVNSPWIRFRDDPRYVEVCDQINADLEKQAKRIRTMLAQRNVDELLAPLIALAEQQANGDLVN